MPMHAICEAVERLQGTSLDFQLLGRVHPSTQVASAKHEPQSMMKLLLWGTKEQGLKVLAYWNTGGDIMMVSLNKSANNSLFLLHLKEKIKLLHVTHSSLSSDIYLLAQSITCVSCYKS